MTKRINLDDTVAGFLVRTLLRNFLSEGSFSP